MDFFKNFDWSFKSIMKVIGILLLGVVVISIAISLLGFSFRTIFSNSNNYSYNGRSLMESASPMYDSYGGESMKLSQSNIIPPSEDHTTGTDAEDFEIKTYNANIKTMNIEKTCETISSLKSREDVIFESSNQNKDYCNYGFKVKKDKTEEILQIIESLDPESLNENIRTIKNSIDGYNDQLEIYKKKLAAIEETLASAQSSYDEVSELATEKEDVESLTNIIDKKLGLIEKLTTERLNVQEQIDRYTKNKSRELDTLDYSFFNVSIYEEKIINWENIKNSWEYEITSFVNNINDILQAVSVDLVSYILRFIQAAIYFFISLFLLKFVWVATKRIWK